MESHNKAHCECPHDLDLIQPSSGRLCKLLTIIHNRYAGFSGNYFRRAQAK